MASMGSMTTTRRTRKGMTILWRAQRLLGTLQSSVCDGCIRPLGKTVNHATDVYTFLPRNVDPVPWLAGLGYVKKPQDSSTYECAALSCQGNFMESMITNGKPKLTGLKVLVIDDSKTIRRTAETLLTKEGCE